MSKVKISTASMQMVYNKEKNLEKMIRFTEEAAKNGSKIIAFPEIALQGYPIDTSKVLFEDYEYQFENSETVPDGPSCQKLIEVAKKNDIYIVFGMTERDSEYQYKLYNSSVMVGPEGHVGTYRKVHCGMCENFVWSRGDKFAVWDTKIGKIGTCICYDQWFPEAFRELALQGAQLVVFITAWPFLDSSKPHEEDLMLKQYQMLQQVRPMENTIYMIGSNLVGRADECKGKTSPYDFMGYSNIVDPCGNIIASTECNEGIVYAEVDLLNDIYMAQREGYIGDQVMKDRAPATYTHMQTSLF